MSAWTRRSASVRLGAGLVLVCLAIGGVIGAEPDAPYNLHREDQRVQAQPAKAQGVVTWV